MKWPLDMPSLPPLEMYLLISCILEELLLILDGDMIAWVEQELLRIFKSSLFNGIKLVSEAIEVRYGVFSAYA